METCDQAVMDFLAATDIGKFPAQVCQPLGIDETVFVFFFFLPSSFLFFFPLYGELLGAASLLFISFHLFIFHLSAGISATLTGSPGGGGEFGSVIL